jgi:hypothetical protein
MKWRPSAAQQCPEAVNPRFESGVQTVQTATAPNDHADDVTDLHKVSMYKMLDVKCSALLVTVCLHPHACVRDFSATLTRNHGGRLSRPAAGTIKPRSASATVLVSTITWPLRRAIVGASRLLNNGVCRHCSMEELLKLLEPTCYMSPDVSK